MVYLYNSEKNVKVQNEFNKYLSNFEKLSGINFKETLSISASKNIKGGNGKTKLDNTELKNYVKVVIYVISAGMLALGAAKIYSDPALLPIKTFLLRLYAGKCKQLARYDGPGGLIETARKRPLESYKGALTENQYRLRLIFDQMRSDKDPLHRPAHLIPHIPSQEAEYCILYEQTKTAVINTFTSMKSGFTPMELITRTLSNNKFSVLYSSMVGIGVGVNILKTSANLTYQGVNQGSKIIDGLVDMLANLITGIIQHRDITKEENALVTETMEIQNAELDSLQLQATQKDVIINEVQNFNDNLNEEVKDIKEDNQELSEKLQNITEEIKDKNINVERKEIKNDKTKTRLKRCERGSRRNKEGKFKPKTTKQS